jgi:hypothetical protein
MYVRIDKARHHRPSAQVNLRRRLIAQRLELVFVANRHDPPGSDRDAAGRRSMRVERDDRAAEQDQVGTHRRLIVSAIINTTCPHLAPTSARC